jgi:hypothetical protein
MSFAFTFCAQFFALRAKNCAQEQKKYLAAGGKTIVKRATA